MPCESLLEPIAARLLFELPTQTTPPHGLVAELVPYIWSIFCGTVEASLHFPALLKNHPSASQYITLLTINMSFGQNIRLRAYVQVAPSMFVFSYSSGPCPPPTLVRPAEESLLYLEVSQGSARVLSVVLPLRLRYSHGTLKSPCNPLRHPSPNHISLRPRNTPSRNVVFV